MSGRSSSGDFVGASKQVIPAQRQSVYRLLPDAQEATNQRQFLNSPGGFAGDRDDKLSRLSSVVSLPPCPPRRCSAMTSNAPGVVPRLSPYREKSLVLIVVPDPEPDQAIWRFRRQRSVTCPSPH